MNYANSKQDGQDVQDAEDDRCGGREPDAEREIFLILSILPILSAVAVPVVPQLPSRS
jgi:hypothetical protein